MHAQQLVRAVSAATATAASAGLEVRDTAVLSASNKLTLHLLPCDAVARVAPAALDGEALRTAGLEVDVAQQLQRAGAPVAPPDPRAPARVHVHGGFATTFWTRVETTATAVSPGDYAAALARLHAGLREVEVPVPHATERVRRAEQLLARTDRTPHLLPADRELLQEVLAAVGERLRATGAEQLLHGEPHPGNLLATGRGPVFIDWETCCRGPVELDLAHAPEGVGEAYPGADLDLLADCRLLALALVTTWRYDVEDRLPGGRALGEAWLRQLRLQRSSR